MLLQRRSISIDISILAPIVFLLGMLLLSACGPTVTSTPAPGPDQSTPTMPVPIATTVVPTPTATPEPLAVRVNGEGVSLAEYEAELRLLQEAQQTLGKTASAEEQRTMVMDNLVDMALLAQGAYENGFVLDEESLQAEVDQLIQQMGGEQALQEWMSQQGYTETTFRAALKRSQAAAWQRDQIAASVPETAEQVHARQILAQDEENANQALEKVKQPGMNFAAYASQYDPLAGGDLGWFPRGYLTQPEVEEAVFNLQPGEISPVIHSQIGYHIVQVISREPSRAISPDARRVLQHKALQEWLKARKVGGQIEVMLP